MTNDAYEKLRQIYDVFPTSFPKTEEGYEIELLKKFFTPEEVEVACHLDLMMSDQPVSPKNVQTIADELGKDANEVERILEQMTKNAVIFKTNDENGLKAFGLLPFAPGVVEFQAYRYDEETSLLIDKYLYGAQGQEQMKAGIALCQVIPVSESVSAPEMEIHPYEDIVWNLENATSICVMPCMCRTHKKLLGEGCDAPIDVCLFQNEFADFLIDAGKGRSVSKEEAKQILKQAEDAGLIHCNAYNQGHYMGLCSCCPCCCHPLSMLIKTKDPKALAKSGFIATVDPDLCTACETCIDKCVFDALEIENEMLTIDPERCMGCGQCIGACPTEALALQRKPPEEVAPVPQDWDEMFSKMGWRR